MPEKRYTVEMLPPLKLAAEQTQRTMAGVVECDITPPPGLAKSGYSMLTTSSEGVRIRLKARVIYLRDTRGHSLAIIQCDLHAGSLLVQRLVAQKVAGSTDISAANLVMTATHTHSGPGNFYCSNFYNKNAANEKGLDPTLVEFLVEQLSNAVIRAFRQARPARVATGKQSVWGLSRNRSIKAWLNNPDNPYGELPEDELALKAINPDLYMLRLDLENESGGFDAVACFCTFSTHCTVLTALNKLNTADVFGVAQREAARHIRSHQGASVMCAVAAGTQGDQNPNVPWQGDYLFGHFDVDWPAARRLGAQVGAAIGELFLSLEDQMNEQLDLDLTVREVDMRQTRGANAVAPWAAVGNATAAGAQERRTPWLSAIPFLRAGTALSRRWVFNNGHHGAKRILGFMFQQWVEPRQDFPYRVPLTIARINDLALVPLPFEVTVDAGRRMAEAILAEQPELLKYVAVSSVANGYFGYLTTPEEYAWQEYEGGSTLYGPNTCPYIVEQLATLAKDLPTQSLDLPSCSEFLLNTIELYPRETFSGDIPLLVSSPEYNAGDGDKQEPFWELEWFDHLPSGMRFDESIVHIEVAKGDAWVPLHVDAVAVNDDGLDVAVIYKGKTEQGGCWSAHWYNPPQGKTEQYRFSIDCRHQGQALVSDSFSL